LKSGDFKVLYENISKSYDIPIRYVFIHKPARL
jgi:hypothetical protein